MAILRFFSEKHAYSKQRSHRIEGLSDAVFAIVMTLLVLDIRIPAGELNSERDMWAALIATLPKIFTFFLSFSVVGLFWTVFSNQFNYIQAADRCQNIIALFYFLSISLFPFTASFLSEHLWSSVAVGLYIFNILLTMVMNLIHWLYCYHAGLIQTEGVSKLSIHKAILRRERIAIASHLILGALCFVSSYLALVLTFLVQAIFTFSGFVELYIQPKKTKTALVNNAPI